MIIKIYRQSIIANKVADTAVISPSIVVAYKIIRQNQYQVKIKKLRTS